MNGAALVLIMASSVDGGHGEATDGGARFADQLYSECPPASVPPATQRDDGSWVLPPARAARAACIMETCESRRQQLETAPRFFSAETWALAAVVAALHLVAGAYLGFELGRWWPF